MWKRDIPLDHSPFASQEFFLWSSRPLTDDGHVVNAFLMQCRKQLVRILRRKGRSIDRIEPGTASASFIRGVAAAEFFPDLP